MSGLPQNVVYASLVVAGLMAVAAIADMATGSPFGGQKAFDVLFVISSGIAIYMAIDCLKNAR